MSMLLSEQHDRLVQERIAAFERSGTPEAGRTREDLYRLVAELAQDYAFVVSRDLRVEFLNAEAALLLGAMPEALVGRRASDLFPREESRRMEICLRRVFDTGRTGVYEGRFHPLPGGDVWVDTRLIPVRMGGRVECVLGLSRDMTAEREAEAVLKSSDKRYRLLFEQNLAGVFRATVPGILLECNEAFARILGYASPREIMGRSVVPFYAKPEARGALLEMMRLQRCVANYELQLRKRDGSVVWVLENMNMVEDPEKGPVLEGAIIDITKQKRVQEELKASCEKLQRAMEATIQAMARTVEARDPYTAGHERRVAQLALALAREMELDENRCQAVRMAAVIHDIGKLIVPAEILSKPGQLNELEYQLIKGHPKVSYEILNIIDFPWPVADIILQHHERLNGSGYPMGLCGDQISLEARILAVADTVEAIISHRPYRAAPGTAYALAEIDENRGRLYDDDVVEACLCLFRQRAFEFET